jgi:hypothetical protein
MRFDLRGNLRPFQRQVNKEMANIELPLEGKHTRGIKEEFQRQFSLAKSVWRIALKVIPENQVVGVGKGEYLTLCFIACYVKAMRLYYAIYRLCELGMADESNLQLRTMLELYGRMKSISFKEKDKDSFSKDWAKWGMANDLKFVDAVEKLFPGGGQYVRYSEWRKWIKTESEKFDKGTWDTFLYKGPWGRSFSALCKEIGLEKDIPMYSLLSGTAHGYDLFRYVRKVGDGVAESDLSPVVRGVALNLTTAVSFLHGSLNLINIELGLGKETFVEEIGVISRSMWGMIGNSARKD